MTDYRFDGLGSRTFEHFVQALCLKAITKTSTPFGDGPDGGREATFEGATNYGSDSERWNGYGVIQAKFLQRPTNSTKDGSWILEQLSDELAKYKNRASERRIDYYILATNVTLTSVAGSGSKDKVLAMLRHFKKVHKLKGVDVWDYDKLRILLDNNEDVRRSYMAWITPGDVLADLAEMLKSQRPDFHRLIVNFLQKELLVDQFAKLEQAGHSADEAIPLSQVFVDVPVAPKPHNEPPDVMSGREKPTYFVDLVIRDASLHCGEDDRQLSSDLPAKAIGRHVLIGGPGQGKTTVGQYICQVFRAALLSDVSPTAVAPEALTIVRSIQRQWRDGQLARPGARRVPFRVVLSEFARSLADGQTHGLMAYLTAVFNAKTNSDLMISQFQALLTAYPCIIILDGLDEVPASTNRSQVLSAVKDFWADIATSRITDSGIDALVIATSRPQGYNEDFSPKFYSHRWMVPLSPAQAIEYGEKLAAVRFSGDTDRVAKVQGRIHRAAANSATARLMRSPLQVTILTLLLDRMGQPPQERWPLFDEYFKLIYQREIERDIPAAAILRSHRTNIITVHRQVGLLLQVESERSGGTDARLTVEQFREVVEHHLRDEGHRDGELANLTNSIIEAAAHRLVFLVGLELGQVGFEIRSLQEFMAAEGLMAADDKTTQDRLKAVAGNTNWRNVFLFAAGKCFFDRQYLRDTLHAVCGELNDHPDDLTARLTLAGSELALELLEEGSARRQPKWNRMLTRTALRVLDDASDEWPARLAEVWQSDTSDVFLGEILGRIESDEFVSAKNAWLCLSNLAVYAGAEFAHRLTELLATRQTDEKLFEALLQDGNGACVPLNSFLGDAVADHPARLFAAASASYVLHTPRTQIRWDYPEIPIWLKSLHALLEQRYAQPRTQGWSTLPLLFGETAIAQISIRQVMAPNELPQELRAIPSRGRGWAATKAYVNFILSPNKETLAYALRQAEADTGEAGIYWWASLVPWPLAEATYAAGNTGRWEELAHAAETGLLGDTRDWSLWQKGWLERGLAFADIIEGDVLDAGLSGRPWCPSRIAPRGLSEVFPVPHDDLIEGVVAAPPGPGRDLLLPLLMENILDHKSTELSLDPPSSDFLEIVFNWSWPMGLECLRIFFPNAPIDRRWLGLLTDVRKARHELSSLSMRTNAKTFNALQQAWLSAPDLKGLLPILASFGPLRMLNSQFVERLASIDVSIESRQIKQARLILLLAGSYWDEAMTGQVREMITSDNAALRVFTRAVLSKGFSPEVERTLLRLHEIAQASSVQTEPVINALRQLMRSRKSPLTTATAWTKLGFSPELSQLIEPDS
ncbi:NACHT domain-containing protein [Spirillospora sp. CA-294931]|uniref:NACHT domain-containing protein n=1 Tax=Spirillospora sp. CA-294931 TaxID=3240042 RepID=UPI003D8D4286